MPFTTPCIDVERLETERAGVGRSGTDPPQTAGQPLVFAVVHRRIAAGTVEGASPVGPAAVTQAAGAVLRKRAVRLRVEYQRRLRPVGHAQRRHASRKCPGQTQVVVVPHGQGIGRIGDQAGGRVAFLAQRGKALLDRHQPPTGALLIVVLAGVVEDDQLAPVGRVVL